MRYLQNLRVLYSFIAITGLFFVTFYAWIVGTSNNPVRTILVSGVTEEYSLLASSCEYGESVTESNPSNENIHLFINCSGFLE